MKRWIACLLAPSALWAAPIPTPKAKPLGPAIVAGAPYRIHWFGDEYDGVFHATGLYTGTSPAGNPWVGQWRLEGRTLIVDESPASQIAPLDPWPPAAWTLQWTMEMDVPGGRGLTVGGNPSSGKATITRKK